VKRLGPEEIRIALRKRVRDVIAPGLQVLFCGINPGLYTAATGHHFAGPGNRFWPTMYAAGFTPRLFTPYQDADLLELGLGITNLVHRPTASADQLGKEELVAGGKLLVRKLRRYRPEVLAVVGLGAFRTAFEKPKAGCGLQAEAIGDARVWLLPNPSGLNAHHQGPTLVRMFAELQEFSRAAKAEQ
jgi:TDG/mug DNA glycosylase family protein